MKHKTIYIVSLSFLLLAITACKKEEKVEKKAVARVLDVYLYEEDLRDVVPPNTSPKDSASKIDDYIKKWVKTQLMVKQAEKNLTTNEKNVRKQLEEYRASLLIHKYQEKYTHQKMDTTITRNQIMDFYNQHAKEFPLTFNIIKGLFIKVTKDAPSVNQIKYLYTSPRENDLDQLAEYCNTPNTETFTDFNNQWISFSSLLEKIPLTVENQQDFLKKNRYIEVEDSSFLYLVHIKDYRLKNEVSPLFFVEGHIRTILLKKRKQDLLSQMENKLYKKAVDNKSFEIYKQEKPVKDSSQTDSKTNNK